MSEKNIEKDKNPYNKKSPNYINDNDELEFIDNDIDDIEFDENEDEENEDEDLDYIEDEVTEMDENVDFDLIYRLNTNKHRQEGKHSLQRDTIFKGKLEKKPSEGNEYLYENENSFYNDGFKLIDVEYDSYTDDYINQNNLTKDVYNVLNKKTKLDFTQNRRKPNKETFNKYYNLLVEDLGFRYTKSELFVELSYYFTDNIFNMFKLLNKKSGNVILKELMQKGHLKNIKGVEFL